MELFDFERGEQESSRDLEQQIFALESSLQMLDVLASDKDLKKMDEEYLNEAKTAYAKIIFQHIPEDINVVQLGMVGWASKVGAEKKDMQEVWSRKDIECYINDLKEEL